MPYNYPSPEDLMQQTEMLKQMSLQKFGNTGGNPSPLAAMAGQQPMPPLGGPLPQDANIPQQLQQSMQMAMRPAQPAPSLIPLKMVLNPEVNASIAPMTQGKFRSMSGALGLPLTGDEQPKPYNYPTPSADLILEGGYGRGFGTAKSSPKEKSYGVRVEGNFAEGGEVKGYEDGGEVSSNDATLNPTILQNYQTLFNRAPDVEGANYWLNQLNSGISNEQLLANMRSGAQGADLAYLNRSVPAPTVAPDITSPFPAQQTTLSNVSVPSTSTLSNVQVPNVSSDAANLAKYGDVLSKDYQTLFNRAPDIAGEQYWANQLASGAVNPNQLMSALAGGAQGADINALKTYETPMINELTRLYSGMFGRTPDTSGQQYWLNQLLDQSTPEDLLVTQLEGGAQGADIQNRLKNLQTYDTAVKQAYQNLTQTAPPSDDLTYWTKQLYHGNESLDNLQADIKKKLGIIDKPVPKIPVITPPVPKVPIDTTTMVPTTNPLNNIPTTTIPNTPLGPVVNPPPNVDPNLIAGSITTDTKLNRVNPDGSDVLLPAGSTVLKDGSVIRPDGSIVTATSVRPYMNNPGVTNVGGVPTATFMSSTPSMYQKTPATTGYVGTSPVPTFYNYAAQNALDRAATPSPTGVLRNYSSVGPAKQFIIQSPTDYQNRANVAQKNVQALRDQINNAYQNAYNRNASTFEMNNALTGMQNPNNPLTQTDLVSQLATTPEKTIRDAYLSVFGRQPDIGGLNYYKNLVGNNLNPMSKDQLVAELTRSPEYAIEQEYKNDFGTTAPYSKIKTYLDMMTGDNPMSLADVLAKIAADKAAADKAAADKAKASTTTTTVDTSASSANDHKKGGYIYKAQGGFLRTNDAQTDNSMDTQTQMNEMAKGGAFAEGGSVSPLNDPHIRIKSVLTKEFEKRGLSLNHILHSRAAMQQALEHARLMGKGNDTILAHITPDEAKLLKEHGGSGKINPATGLPMFDDGDGDGDGGGDNGNGGVGGRDSNNADSTGQTGGNAGDVAGEASDRGNLGSGTVDAGRTDTTPDAAPPDSEPNTNTVMDSVFGSGKTSTVVEALNAIMDAYNARMDQVNPTSVAKTANDPGLLGGVTNLGAEKTAAQSVSVSPDAMQSAMNALAAGLNAQNATNPNAATSNVGFGKSDKDTSLAGGATKSDATNTSSPATQDSSTTKAADLSDDTTTPSPEGGGVSDTAALIAAAILAQTNKQNATPADKTLSNVQLKKGGAVQPQRKRA